MERSSAGDAAINGAGSHDPDAGNGDLDCGEASETCNITGSSVGNQPGDVSGGLNDLTAGTCVGGRGAHGGQSTRGGRGRGGRGGRGAQSGRGKGKKPVSKRGKVWGNDEVLLLINAWKAASLLPLHDGHTAKQAAASVYSVYISRLLTLKSEVTGLDVEGVGEFLAGLADTPPFPEGGLAIADPSFRPRSQRAVEDKMASLRSAYTLISDHNNGTLGGSTGRPEWFSIPTAERTDILKKWGRVALSADCFAALGGVFEDDPSINLVRGGIELGSACCCDEGRVAESPTRGTKRSRVDEIADMMNDVMEKAVRSKEAIAQQDREQFILHQAAENEKTGALLRELFSANP